MGPSNSWVDLFRGAPALAYLGSILFPGFAALGRNFPGGSYQSLRRRLRLEVTDSRALGP